MNQKGFSVLIILLLIIFFLISIIIAGTFFYLGKINSSQNTVTKEDAVSSGIIREETSYPEASVTQIFGEYKKRFVSEGELLIGKLKYPEELFRLNENGLMNMSCAPGVFEDNGSFRYVVDREDSQGSIVQDQFLLETAKKAKEKAADILAYLMVCKLTDGRAVVLYEVDGGGGGSLNRAYFGELSQAGNLEQITVIPNDGSPYFACTKILQFNLANMLWVACGGGDGGYSSASVYRVDYHNKTASLVTKCESKSDLDENGNYYEKCQ